MNAAWVTVTVWPAIVSVPSRCAPLLAATVNVTDPEPDPLAADVIAIQSAFRVAVQAQFDAVVMLIAVPAPPAAATTCCAGETW